MKICLISPDSPGLIDPKVFPPLGILYLSAVLKQAGHEVEVLDFAGEGPLELPLFDQDPDVVGITATTPQFPIAVHILKYLQDKNINTIIGGPHATVAPGIRSRTTCPQPNWGPPTLPNRKPLLATRQYRPTLRSAQETTELNKEIGLCLASSLPPAY